MHRIEQFMLTRFGRMGGTFVILSLGFAVQAADNDPNSKKPTFTRDVAPIMHANCVTCHRPGEIAPMSLLTFEDARPWAKSIRKYVSEGVMPPWHADPGFGPWTNDRSLEKSEIDTIVAWVDAGSPQGNPADMPEPPVFADSEWEMGEPDYIVEFKEITVPGSGPDKFENLEHQTDFATDRWIKAIQILPGDRSVVHHVILWQFGDTNQPTPDGWLGAWAAGAGPEEFPERTGRLLKKGARLIGDMHYHPTDTDATDVTRVGIYFADEDEIEKQLVNLWVMNVDFAIPAGDPNYEARSSFTFTQDSTILGLAPHMHYRGKDFNYTLTLPDGSSTELLKVSKYDFNWQTGYEFVEPVAAPKGSRIDCIAHWDNSADNAANPDPMKNVRFGTDSTDEMMIGFVDYIVDEGIRPAEGGPSPVTAKLAELVAMYPGEVFEVRIPMGGAGLSLTALHLPPEGDGGWYVEFGAIVGKAPVHDIVWDGDRFTAKATIPGEGTMGLGGKVDRDKGTIGLVMTDPSGTRFPVPGKIAK